VKDGRQEIGPIGKEIVLVSNFTALAKMIDEVGKGRKPSYSSIR